MPDFETDENASFGLPLEWIYWTKTPPDFSNGFADQALGQQGPPQEVAQGGGFITGFEVSQSISNKIAQSFIEYQIPAEKVEAQGVLLPQIYQFNFIMKSSREGVLKSMTKIPRGLDLEIARNRSCSKVTQR